MVNVPGHLGPPLIGGWINLVLWGVLFVQVYMYYLNFPRDRLITKLTVYTLFILEGAQSILLCHSEFYLYAADFTSPAAMADTRLFWLSVPIMTGITGAIAQVFFGFRIYALGSVHLSGWKRWIPTILVWILALLQGGAGIGQGVQSIPLKMSEIADKTHITLMIWLITSTVNDILIAGLMSYFLRTMRTSFKHTDQILARLVNVVVRTGALTATCAVVIIVLYFVAHDPWYLIFTKAIGKLYANNVMVLLNHRATLRSAEPTGIITDSSMPTPTAVSLRSPRTDIMVTSNVQVFTDDIPMKPKTEASRYSMA